MLVLLVLGRCMMMMMMSCCMMMSRSVGRLSTGVGHVVHKVPLLFVLRPGGGTSVADGSRTGDG